MNAAKNNADQVDHKETQLSKDTAAKAQMNIVQPDPDKAPAKTDETPKENIPATNVQASRHTETGMKNSEVSANIAPVKPESEKVERQKEIDKAKGRKTFKPGKYYLRAAASHPRRAYQLGRHSIGPAFQEFELNEAEARELGTEGPQKWVQQGDKAAAKKDQEIWKGLDAKTMDSQGI